MIKRLEKIVLEEETEDGDYAYAYILEKGIVEIVSGLGGEERTILLEDHMIEKIHGALQMERGRDR